MNTQLRDALVRSGLTAEDLASACSVDPKTVGRWLSGRVPHRRHRWTVACRLGTEEANLWPQRAGDNSLGPELVAAYPNRASVPRELWLSLLLDATRQIDVLVFSGTFFAQTNPSIARMLRERAQDGVRVRLCFGDPDGQAIALRGQEEGIGDSLAGKVRASLTYYRELVGVPGCDVRLHDTTLYNSLFRYDDHLLVNPHIWGQPASANPLMQIERSGEEGWFGGYEASFTAVWSTAQPWTPERQEQHFRGQD
ncbi:XRE family transcriptional regulator [Streptomyces sp. NPDC048442]|uniref:XRE family transcriptional regulator n=1 Tax=Streptomyces sp. NPDC048442 TaxID=3154823 RepID=UPI00341933E3